MKRTARELARVIVDAAAKTKGKELEVIVNTFVQELSNGGRLHEWRAIARAVDREWKKQFGVSHVVFESAVSPSEILVKEIEAIACGASITMQVDKRLIGGARVRIDDRVIDGTIAGSLERLRQHLSEVI